MKRFNSCFGRGWSNHKGVHYYHCLAWGPRSGNGYQTDPAAERSGEEATLSGPWPRMKDKASLRDPKGKEPREELLQIHSLLSVWSSVRVPLPDRSAEAHMVTEHLKCGYKCNTHIKLWSSYKKSKISYS
jgi:hypothetical protein